MSDTPTTDPLDLAMQAIMAGVDQLDDAYLDMPALAELLDAYVAASPDERRDFLLSHELCPVHHSDLGNCADDDLAECREFWHHAPDGDPNAEGQTCFYCSETADADDLVYDEENDILHHPHHTSFDDVPE